MAEYSKAGCENPATSQHVSFTSKQDVSKATAAKAGSFAREFPEAPKAGQDVAGESKTLAKAMKPKQTWEGPAKGYTTRDFPNYTPAVKFTEAGATRVQQVKGKSGSAPSESKQVAGVSN
jgi:hypothetical protein